MLPEITELTATQSNARKAKTRSGVTKSSPVWTDRWPLHGLEEPAYTSGMDRLSDPNRITLFDGPIVGTAGRGRVVASVVAFLSALVFASLVGASSLLPSLDLEPLPSYQSDKWPAASESAEWVAFGSSFIGMGIDPESFRETSGSTLFNWGMPDYGARYRQRVLESVRSGQNVEGVILEMRPGPLDPTPADAPVNVASPEVRFVRSAVRWSRANRPDRAASALGGYVRGKLPVGRLLFYEPADVHDMTEREDGLLAPSPHAESLSAYEFSKGFKDVANGAHRSEFHIEEMERLRDALTHMGVRVVFVRMPEGNACVNEAEAVARLNAINLNDRDAFPELFRWEHRWDDTHLNGEGAKIAAEILGRSI